MKKTISKEKSILLALALSVLSLGALSAEAASTPPPVNSLYLYNALENKYSFEQLINNDLPEETVAVAPEDIALAAPVLSLEERTRIQEEKVRVDLEELTLKQEKAIKDADEAVKRISAAGEWRSTVLGNNLGSLEFHLVQIKGLQAALNSLVGKTVDVPLKLKIGGQIEELKEEQTKIEEVLAERSDKFSFIGWLVATI